MCAGSTVMSSRRALEGEELAVVARHGFKVTAPVIGDVDCACLKAGDCVQFMQLPIYFQLQYGVSADAQATFIESDANHDQRDMFDKFDFGGKTVVNLRDMPEHVNLKPIHLVGDPKNLNQVRVPVFEIEPVLAGADVHRGNANRPSTLVHAGVLGSAFTRTAIGACLGAIIVAVVFLR